MSWTTRKSAAVPVRADRHRHNETNLNASVLDGLRSAGVDDLKDNVRREELDVVGVIIGVFDEREHKRLGLAILNRFVRRSCEGGGSTGADRAASMGSRRTHLVLKSLVKESTHATPLGRGRINLNTKNGGRERCGSDRKSVV